MRKSFLIILSLILIISLIIGGIILFSNPKPTPERKILSEGSTKGIFDIDSLTPEKRDSLQGNIGAFCTFFVTPAAYPDEFENSYGWEFYRRFFSFFGDKELYNFQEDKVETYFSAVYSASIGKDMREKLRFWGFNIDNEYFNQIYPQLVSSVS
jgi:ABC-type antimicrobial peptide transport system permease subunit